MMIRPVMKFGLVKVYIDDPDALNEYTEPRVTINWSAVGEVGIRDAQKFSADLSSAIEYAATAAKSGPQIAPSRP